MCANISYGDLHDHTEKQRRQRQHPQSALGAEATTASAPDAMRRCKKLMSLIADEYAQQRGDVAHTDEVCVGCVRWCS
jgi:hypothetical protein